MIDVLLADTQQNDVLTPTKAFTLMRSIAGKIPLHEHKTEISPPQSSKARIQGIFWTIIFSRS
jgi:hypothetical protein